MNRQKNILSYDIHSVKAEKVIPPLTSSVLRKICRFNHAFGEQERRKRSLLFYGV